MTSAPDRMRAILKEPGLLVMPAVWDGLTAKLEPVGARHTRFATHIDYRVIRD